ncbi:MAG: Protein FecR [Pseudomonadales bacterium]|nr:Protein FecR [Pseudomonadales bacterium]
MIDTATAAHSERLDQATAWFVRLRADDISVQERAEFARWLARDADNAAAFDRMTILWSELGTALGAREPVHPASAVHRRRWWPAVALAAAAGVAAVLLLPRQAAETLELRTPVGGFRQVELADGSDLTLNTDTALHVELSAHARRVTIAHGEAFFRVTPDAARPFTASCGEAAVTVLGTAFAVDCRAGGMRVVVEHGLVRFGERGAGGTTRLLHAGESARYADGDGIEDVVPANLETELAWQQRKLVFEDAPLAELIDELQRHMQPALRITDTQTAAIRVSGVFGTDDPRLTLAALERSLGITVSGPEDGPLLISRAAD